MQSQAAKPQNQNHRCCLKSQMPFPANKQKGFTLLELLIALLISSIVLLGITTLLTSSAEARNRVSSVRLMQEEATLVSHVLHQQLAQIAYRPIDSTLLESRRLPIEETLIKFPAVEGQWTAGQIVKADNNSVSFRYSGANDPDENPDGSLITCVGDTVSEDEVVVTTLLLDNNQFSCETDNEIVLLAGSANSTRVEQMQVELGIDSDGDLQLDKILLAASATEKDLLNVRLVRIRLLLASADRAIRFHQPYQFSNQSFTPSDFRLRKEIVVTMATRN